MQHCNFNWHAQGPSVGIYCTQAYIVGLLQDSLNEDDWEYYCHAHAENVCVADGKDGRLKSPPWGTDEADLHSSRFLPFVLSWEPQRAHPFDWRTMTHLFYCYGTVPTSTSEWRTPKICEFSFNINNDQGTKIVKKKPWFMEAIFKRCAALYIIGGVIVIDEFMVSCLGQFYFKQYIKINQRSSYVQETQGTCVGNAMSSSTKKQWHIISSETVQE